jgi:hypothetical protein
MKSSELCITVDQGAVCVSIEVTFIQNGTKTNTDTYHITNKTFIGATQKPIYKLDCADLYIFYSPNANGWIIGDIIGNRMGDFYYESKNIII